MSVESLERHVSAETRRAIADLLADLESLDTNNSVLHASIVERIGALIGADAGLIYRLEPTMDGLSLVGCVGTGPLDGEAASRELQRVLEETNRGRAFGGFDPLRPAADQRNRAIKPRTLMDDHALRETAATRGQRRLGLDALDELRVLVCEGNRLLAWVGGYREGSFTAREEAILEVLAQPLRKRFEFERRFEFAELSSTALDTVLDTLTTPAFIVDRRTRRVLFANETGRARLASLDLDGALAGAPGFDVRAVPQPGGGSGVHLVLATNNDERSRLSVCRKRWGLTKRQAQVLALVVDGFGNKEVAADLGISLRTAELHVSALLEAANVQSRAQLVSAFWTLTP